MIQSLRRILKQYITKQTIRNWLLILGIFIILTNILRESIQGVENSFLMLMIMVGLILGWLLSITPTSSVTSLIVFVISGGLLLLVRVGRLGGLLSQLASEIINWFRGLFLWVSRGSSFPSGSSLNLGFEELGNRIFTMGTRLADWFINIIQGSPLFDPVATALVWGYLFWTLAIWMMWFIFRQKRPLAAVLPVVILTSLSLIYTGKSAYNLVPLLGLATGLLILVRYDTQELTWKEKNLEYAGIIREKMVVSAVLLALMVMFIAALSPAFTIRSIREMINSWTEDQVNEDDLVRSLGIEPQPDPANVSVLDSRRVGGLPNRHLIGSGEELSDQVVMIIRPEILTTSEREQAPDQEFRFYWRGLTYDRYVGRGWVSRDSVNQDYQPGQQTLADWPDSYRIIRQQVEFTEDLGGLLFSAGIPLSANQSFQVAWRVQNPEDQAYDVFGATIPAETYLADSLQPQAGKTELRDAGQDYPDWIQSRYLRLPESVPERVLALARDLTATEPTPYDRAVAIESYLRRFPYNLNLPQPPLDQDITDYFLFGVQEGYCDYYATSMVVLARASGIPARLVTGYIGGTYDPELEGFLVTADLAHAWVEVYFPGYGWIIFEPTGGRPAMDRPADPIPKFNQDYRASFDPLVPDKPTRELPWPLIIISVFLGAGITIFVGFQVDSFIIRKIPAEKQVPMLYKRLYRYGKWLGIRSQPGDTIYQYQDRVLHLMEIYGRGSREAEWLFEAVNPLKGLTRDYIQVLYAPADQLKINPFESGEAFLKIRTRLWYLWLLIYAYRFRFLRIFLWNAPPMVTSQDQT